MRRTAEFWEALTSLEIGFLRDYEHSALFSSRFSCGVCGQRTVQSPCKNCMHTHRAIVNKGREAQRKVGLPRRECLYYDDSGNSYWLSGRRVNYNAWRAIGLYMHNPRYHEQKLLLSAFANADGKGRWWQRHRRNLPEEARLRRYYKEILDMLVKNMTEVGLKALALMDDKDLVRIYKGAIRKNKMNKNSEHWNGNNIAWYDFCYGYFFALTGDDQRAARLAHLVYNLWD